ncbi:hypothetical protein, partial [Rhodosalinus sediminis]|uniref:hypothetical protein n=1 Tax=Rhodosalinus sediminis TaxID=1940533 RepID=UPI001961A2BD
FGRKVSWVRRAANDKTGAEHVRVGRRPVRSGGSGRAQLGRLALAKRAAVEVYDGFVDGVDAPSRRHRNVPM